MNPGIPRVVPAKTIFLPSGENKGLLMEPSVIPRLSSPREMRLKFAPPVAPYSSKYILRFKVKTSLIGLPPKKDRTESPPAHCVLGNVAVTAGGSTVSFG